MTFRSQYARGRSGDVIANDVGGGSSSAEYTPLAAALFAPSIREFGIRPHARNVHATRDAISACSVAKCDSNSIVWSRLPADGRDVHDVADAGRGRCAGGIGADERVRQAASQMSE